MSDLREALDHILRLCNDSRTYTRRTQTIHEVAMTGLGMTKNQRQERHMAIMFRIGGIDGVNSYRHQCEVRAAKRQANLEKKLAALEIGEPA